MNRAYRVAVLAVLAWVGLGASGSIAADSPAQRSAQSDCQREAARRGYTVLATRNYQQYKDGWSVELQARDQAGRVSWGSCFVETRTGDVSLFGFGWGGSGGSMFEFNCASVEGKYRECQLPVNGRARLVKQKSDSPCIAGQTWGQRGDRVWVDNGCRAKFEVTVGGSGGAGGSGQHVDCRSEQQRYRECSIPRGYVGRLINDDSGGKCRNTGAWGTRDGLIWVNFGCKGRFELVSSGIGSGGGGGGNAGQQQRAEVHCRNQASREGIAVRYVEPAQLRGAYWETTVDGTHGLQRVRPTCRYYPASNRAELHFGGGSGGGSGGSGQANVERTCLGEAQRQGLRVYEQGAARPISGGYGMQMQVRRGNSGPLLSANCRYWTTSGRAEISY